MTGLASQRVREVPVKTDPAIPGAPPPAPGST